MSYGQCNFKCTDKSFQCVGPCEKWFHYACTKLPPYFVLHLEQQKKFDYVCETCMLKKYPNAPIAIGKIETAIDNQKLLGTGGNQTGGGIDTPVAVETVVETNNGETNTIHDVSIDASNLSVVDVSNLSGPSNHKKRICVHYAQQGKCKYGKQCRYRHPPMCRKFIKDGVYGCKKEQKCNFFHPRLCNNSTKFSQCNRRVCRYFHLTDTFRPNAVGNGHINGDTGGQQDNINNNYNNATDYNDDNNYVELNQNDISNSNNHQPNHQDIPQTQTVTNNGHVGDNTQIQHSQNNQQNETVASFLGYMRQLDMKISQLQGQHQAWIQRIQPHPFTMMQHPQFQPMYPHTQAYNIA